MSKWFGKIGLVQTVETEPSIFEEKVTEHDCYGVQTGDKVNDDLTIANILSILADPTLYKHFDSIKYAEIMGARWKVTEVQIDYPRLTLTLGGLYNGGTPTET